MTKLELQTWMLNQSSGKVYETAPSTFIWTVTPGAFLEGMPQHYDVVCRNFPGRASRDTSVIEVRHFDDNPGLFYFKITGRADVFLSLPDAIKAVQKYFLKSIGYEEVKMVI